MTDVFPDPASFKDPAGFVFQYQGKFFRCVQPSYASHYRQLVASGLYRELTQKAWLLPHTEYPETIPLLPDCHALLLPEQLSCISYASEWSFDMLRDAALLTLSINLAAIEHGMILKDATPFNIQFYKGRPVFIDTLSFEQYNASKPWIAYRQFCEMFLFPLYLAAYLDVDSHSLLTAYPEGIPARVTAKLLPVRSRLNMGVWLHVHLQNALRSGSSSSRVTAFNKTKLQQLLQYLYNIIRDLATSYNRHSTWSNYYEETILSPEYLVAKEALFRSFLEGIRAESALDLGANDGYFSRILAGHADQVIAADADTRCINRLYLSLRKDGDSRIIPLVIDLAHPSPGTGFNNRERRPFLQRAESYVVAALALVHHLVFTGNIPLYLVADCLGALTKQYLIVEFVPITDEKVEQLIRNKTAWHLPYDAASFEKVFSARFTIEKKAEIGSSGRILYLMKKTS